LHAYAPNFFASDKTSPWGAAIDFSQPDVREFFTQNALYWLHEYRFDGLRFDAAHAISDPGWLDEMAARVRAAAEPGRHIHLMLENEHNRASHLAGDFDAQWSDDWHNAMHVLLTGEREGYYAAYVGEPAQKIARSLAEGFIYQGEPSPIHANRPRGEPSASLPPTAFINFLQNHDQIGNRAFGERLTVLAGENNLRAAITLQLLMPAIPLLFMGEQWQTRTPFLFFTDFHDALADAVRDGRRKEFTAFAAFQNEQQRASIPDPNSLDTFLASIPHADEKNSAKKNAALALYRELLQLRRRHIVPRLDGCRALGAKAIDNAAVMASWQFSDGARLHIAVNFSDTTLSIDPLHSAAFLNSALLFESVAGAAAAAARGKLIAHCAIAALNEPRGENDAR
jgi:maltooligosyltrehalose trehalohydrolase